MTGLDLIVFMNKEKFSHEFLEWLPENYHIWRAFEDQALQIVYRGFSHYSARTIVHVLRHHSALTEASGEWKINNNISPYLARLFAVVHPEYKTLFEYRKVNV